MLITILLLTEVCFNLFYVCLFFNGGSCRKCFFGTKWDKGWMLHGHYQFWYNIQQIYDIIDPVIIVAVSKKRKKKRPILIVITIRQSNMQNDELLFSSTVLCDCRQTEVKQQMHVCFFFFFIRHCLLWLFRPLQMALYGLSEKLICPFSTCIFHLVPTMSSLVSAIHLDNVKSEENKSNLPMFRCRAVGSGGWGLAGWGVELRADMFNAKLKSILDSSDD